MVKAIEMDLSCPGGKIGFKSKKVAKKEGRRRKMDAYRCKIRGCTGWHLATPKKAKGAIRYYHSH